MKMTSNSKTILKGKPLRNSVSLEEKYAQELEVLTKRMVLTTKRELERLFDSGTAKAFYSMDDSIASQARILLNKLSNRFNRSFSDKSADIVRDMLRRLSRESMSQLGSSLKEMSGGVTLKISEMPSGMREMMTAVTNTNVELIKSIPEQYLFKVKQEVMRSISYPDGGMKSLIPAIEKLGDHSYKRARQIALDQTRKSYNGMNLARAGAAGVKKGIWVHTGGSKEPRHKHVQYNGKLFELAKGAPVGNNGEYVMPGEQIGCRCTFTPVLDFGED